MRLTWQYNLRGEELLTGQYLLDPITQIDLEFTAFRWNDNIDSANDGRFSVITLAGVRRF